MSLPLKTFRDIDTFIAELREETRYRTRFPVRIILVEGLYLWQEMVRLLQPEVDYCLRLSFFCAGADAFPCAASVVTSIERWLKEDGPSKMLVLPWAEWLRLEAGQEEPREALEQLIKLVQKEKVGEKRLYIPLFESPEVVNQLRGRLTRYLAQGELPSMWKLAGKGSVTLDVLPFTPQGVSGRLVEGVRAYLECWECGGADRLVLVTRWAPGLKGYKANFTVRVCWNAYQVLVNRITLWPDEVMEEWGSEEEWRWLGEASREGESFLQLVTRILNLKKYESSEVMQRWRGWSKRERWLAWLWSKVERTATGYLAKVLAKSNTIEQFENELVIFVLEERITVAEARERKELLEAMGVTELPGDFLTRLRELPDPLHRLACLTGFSEEERELVVLAVGELLERGALWEEWWGYLEVAYPELSWYLTVPPMEEIPEASLQEYFHLYTRSRVRDRADEQLLERARRMAADQVLWKFRARDQALEELKRPETCVLWVDGMSVEWLGVLLKALGERGDVIATFEVVRANLPTVTDNNKGWESEEWVERTVDDEAHRIPYSYPRALVKQLDAVCHTARRAVQLLDTFNEVIITADHGLTRFAKTTGCLQLADGVEVHKWGRCATFSPGFPVQTLLHPGCAVYGNTLVLLTHERLCGAKGISYQVHGGGTPEEWLVPIVRVRKASRPSRAEAVHVQVLTPRVSLNVRSEGELQVKVAGYEGRLELHLQQHVFRGQPKAKEVWVFVLRGLKAGKYRGVLHGHTGKLAEVEFLVLRGLVEEDLGL